MKRFISIEIGINIINFLDDKMIRAKWAREAVSVSSNA